MSPETMERSYFPELNNKTSLSSTRLLFLWSKTYWFDVKNHNQSHLYSISFQIKRQLKKVGESEAKRFNILKW